MNEIWSIVGTLRNPILAFGTVASGMVFYFGNNNNGPIQAYNWFHSIVAVILLFTTFAFYIYAYIRLPANAQEKAFLDNARMGIQEDQRARRMIEERMKND